MRFYAYRAIAKDWVRATKVPAKSGLALSPRSQQGYGLFLPRQGHIVNKLR